MNPEDVKTLIDYLIQNGQILGTKIYELAYRQTIYSLLSSLFWAIFWVVLMYFAVRTSLQIVALHNYKDSGKYQLAKLLINADMETVFIGSTVILSLFVVIFVPFLIDHCINILANPQWMAVKTIFSLLPTQ